MLNLTKEEIETRLKWLLNECLESCNQDGSIIKLDYDETKKVCNVTLSTHIIKEGNGTYVGFEGY